MTAPPLLELAGIRKLFGTKIAIDRIDLSVAEGEVHAVCGENGAGKSTLMNILAGIHRPDAGEIRLGGRPIVVPDPIAAGRLGIGMVHQHFTLVPSMTVAENMYLGRQPRRWGFVSDRAAMRERARALIRQYDFDLDPDARVATLSVGQRQRVEILKALTFDARILILDEPTAVLTPPEVVELLRIIADLRRRGRTILFITHKLREVKEVSDRVTVIRTGRSVASHVTAEVGVDEIARDMVGRPVFLTGRDRSTVSEDRYGAATLRLMNLVMTNAAARRLLDGVTLDVRAGEIFGIAGVDGNGQTELADAVAGVRPVQAGTVEILGRDMTAADPGARRDAGLAFIPEDRLDRGLSPTMSVAENVAAGNYEAASLAGRGIVSVARRDAFAAAKIGQFDIRGARPETRVGFLSGGNMQKVVIARELERSPRVLVVAQPTRGLDIGASEFVHRQILAAADRGSAVLLISSELSEVFGLADRIGVMFRGRLMAVLDRAEATEETVGLLMNGIEREAA